MVNTQCNAMAEPRKQTVEIRYGFFGAAADNQSSFHNLPNPMTRGMGTCVCMFDDGPIERFLMRKGWKHHWDDYNGDDDDFPSDGIETVYQHIAEQMTEHRSKCTRVYYNQCSYVYDLDWICCTHLIVREIQSKYRLAFIQFRCDWE